MKYIVAYDICNPRRLKKLHKTLQGYGIPLQYSIFYVELSTDLYIAMEADIVRIISKQEDDVRVYSIHDFDIAHWHKLSMVQVKSSFLVV